MTISKEVIAEMQQESSKELATRLQHLETVITVARAARIVALLDVMNQLEGHEAALDRVNDMLIDAGK